jgi:hypothetical protein
MKSALDCLIEELESRIWPASEAEQRRDVRREAATTEPQLELQVRHEHTGSRPAKCSSTCYEIEPGRWIHHPWDGCTTPMTAQPERRKAEAVCWHCDGERRCRCSTCWAGGPGECVACRGSGTIRVWLQ